MNVYEVLFQIGLFAMCFFGGGFFVFIVIAILFDEVSSPFTRLASGLALPWVVSLIWTVAAAILAAVVTP